MDRFEFWQSAYLQALHAGKTPFAAFDSANQAVRHFDQFVTTQSGQ